ncbi:MAG: hypothetical protein IKE75_03040 [Bacilli bacterium]|nr:hypothetical protein [Bacilli bacterium]
MNESVGNALLFNLSIMFVVILVAFFVGSLSYSKAAKVKNKIIEEIEKNGEIAGTEYSEYENVAKKAYDNSIEEIDRWLRNGDDNNGIGYRLTNNGYASCPKYKDNEAINRVSNYEYCIYRFDTCETLESYKRDKCGIYYHVTTYMYFDVPIVGDLVRIPVNGETRTFMVRNN